MSVELTNIKPLGDRVVIKRLEENQMSKGGLYLPEVSKEKPLKGHIVALGKGKVLENGTTLPLNTSIGDLVLFGKFAGTEIKIEDETYLIMKEEDILCIIS
jgi:chaperonin GroES